MNTTVPEPLRPDVAAMLDQAAQSVRTQGRFFDRKELHDFLEGVRSPCLHSPCCAVRYALKTAPTDLLVHPDAWTANPNRTIKPYDPNRA